ncbi:hypothetical protein [Lachnoclostridium sp. An181]|uniref:hypothetical protein n=1 Tax=Lachnoclostridium sp. An181 TaxID=1965575 RepID=UPI000B392860|nr:hypothetical protein [Lachnoclostridium sp. An181]OUP50102.1 hypothetical protein B5F18_04680 [Lachnoclostridium sp. An181]
MNDNYPKVLAISLSTWRKDSGIHTQTDLFKYWNPEKVAQIYTRSDLPDTPVCNKFFQISENAVIKSVLNRKEVGCEVKNTKETQYSKAYEEEKRLYAVARKKSSWLLRVLRELVWIFGKWKTKALDKFVQDFNPDIYFVPIYPVIYMGIIQLYVIRKFKKPYVCYMWDDNYSYKPCGYNPLAYIHRFFLRKAVKNLIIHCTKMFAITKMQADEIQANFNIHSIVLTKGIDYDELKYENAVISSPIKMVYTGKLVIGRDRALAEISKALAEINKEEIKITLDIYSPDVVNEKVMRFLNSNGCKYCGCVSKDKVAEIQKAADIVVFVEALEKKYRYMARLSFSTKLTDYFKSGKCILAIGDKDIAPIKYLKENDAGIVITEYQQIKDKLQKLIVQRDLIQKYGRNAFECGRKNHNEKDIKRIFVETLKEAAKE